jgi:predicted HicB family RNase H-like nuclease
MTVSKKQQASVNKYVRENYDRILLTTPKGRKDQIKAHAEAHGESVNAFINRAIDEALQREGGKNDG